MGLGLAWRHHGNLIQDVAIAVQILTKEWRTAKVTGLAVYSGARYYGRAVCCATTSRVNITTGFTCCYRTSAIGFHILIAWIDSKRKLFTKSEL